MLYLNRANEYSRKNFALLDAIKKSHGAIDVNPGAPGPIKDWLDARGAYQDAVNLIYVYGSKAAWDAHRVMASTLPPSLGTLKFEDVDSGKFTKAYQAFQVVFCQELNPRDNNGCQ